MPEDATYRVVLGPRWDNLDGTVAADFLRYFLLPREGHDLDLGPVGLLLRVRSGRAGRLRCAVRRPRSGSPSAGCADDFPRDRGPVRPPCLFSRSRSRRALGPARLAGLDGFRAPRGARVPSRARKSPDRSHVRGSSSASRSGRRRILGGGAAIVAGGLLAGRRKKAPHPALRPAGWRVPTPSLLGAGFIAALVLYFEAAFRSERLAELTTGMRGSRGR